MDPDPGRKAALAFGAALILCMALFETAIADRVRPNPASPWIWSALAAGAVAAFLAALRYRRQARQRRPGDGGRDRDSIRERDRS